MLKRKLKTAILICTIILVPIFVLYFYYFIYGFQISPSSLYIKNISITDNIVKISGYNMHDSALAFSGYNIKLDKEQLVIIPRYSLASPFNRQSKFEIIYNTKSKPIEGIYIKGKNDIKQIWSSSTEAKQVILDFFKYYEQKDASMMESLLIEGKKGITWELNKMKYVKLLKIEDDKSEAMKNGFMGNGLGSVLKPADIKVFRVTFEIKFDGGFGSGMENGTYTWSYFVVKEKEDTPWLIADWGY